MSAEHTDQTAPRLAQARKATAVCGTFGMKAQTRSPGCTPIASSLAANAATRRRSSGQPTTSDVPAVCIDSLRKTIAGWPAAWARSAWRNMCCA